MRDHYRHLWVYAAILAVLSWGALGCESASGDPEPGADTSSPQQDTGGSGAPDTGGTPPAGTCMTGDGEFEMKSPAYSHGEVEYVLRHAGAHDIEINTENIAETVEIQFDGGDWVALDKESNFTFTGEWTISAADNGAHTWTVRITNPQGETCTEPMPWYVRIWTRDENVDSRQIAGLSPVLEVSEATNTMWLLYRTNAGQTEVSVAKKAIDGGTWQSEVVVADALYEFADGGERTPWHLSMDLDSAGNPHFTSIWDENADNGITGRYGLGYFYFDGTTWQKDLVVGAGEKLDPAQPDMHPYYSWEGSNTAIALDANDNPHVVFYRNLATTASVHNGAVWYANKDSGAWQAELIDDDLGDIQQPVGFDRAGLAAAWNDTGDTLVVRYVSHENLEGSLRYAVRQNGAWTKGIVSGDMTGYTWDRASEGSLVFANGKWYTSFHADGVQGTSLHLATFDGTTWTVTPVDNGEMGEYSSLHVGADGHIDIVSRGSINTLQYAWFDGARWMASRIGIEDAEEAVRLGDPGQTQVYIDAARNAHVVFYNLINKKVEYWTAPCLH